MISVYNCWITFNTRIRSAILRLGFDGLCDNPLGIPSSVLLILLNTYYVDVAQQRSLSLSSEIDT